MRLTSNQTSTLLTQTISGIDSALSSIRQGKKASSDSATKSAIPVPVKIPVKIPVKPPVTIPQVPTIPTTPSPVQNILKTFGHVDKQKAFAPVTDTVEGMVSSIEPVLDTFDQLLVSCSCFFLSSSRSACQKKAISRLRKWPDQTASLPTPSYP